MVEIDGVIVGFVTGMTIVVLAHICWTSFKGWIDGRIFEKINRQCSDMAEHSHKMNKRMEQLTVAMMELEERIDERIEDIEDDIANKNAGEW